MTRGEGGESYRSKGNNQSTNHHQKSSCCGSNWQPDSIQEDPIVGRRER